MVQLCVRDKAPPSPPPFAQNETAVLTERQSVLTPSVAALRRAVLDKEASVRAGAAQLQGLQENMTVTKVALTSVEGARRDASTALASLQRQLSAARRSLEQLTAETRVKETSVKKLEGSLTAVRARVSEALTRIAAHKAGEEVRAAKVAWLQRRNECDGVNVPCTAESFDAATGATAAAVDAFVARAVEEGTATAQLG